MTGRHEFVKAALVTACALAASTSHAQLLKVARPTWEALTPGERATIQITQVIEVYEHGSFGLVMDAQGADRSDPGTSGGAVLGSMGAQAAYLDRAFSGGHSYSAKTQLATAIIGGLLGSALDRPATQQYQFRYALRLSDGEVRYMDAVERDPFRHPPGICLSIPALRPVSQTICNYGPDDLRRQFIAVPFKAVSAPQLSGAKGNSTEATQAAAPVAAVLCALGSLPPVNTTAEKCIAIGGSQR